MVERRIEELEVIDKIKKIDLSVTKTNGTIRAKYYKNIISDDFLLREYYFYKSSKIVADKLSITQGYILKRLHKLHKIKTLSEIKKVPIKYIINEKGCWICISHLSKYPRASLNNKLMSIAKYNFKKKYGKEFPVNKMMLHKCDEPQCINPEHIRPGTAKENYNDAVKRNRINIPKGENHWNCKLTNKQVFEIKNTNKNISNKLLAKQYKISTNYIYRLKTNKTRSG